MKAIILAGGSSSRLHPLTQAIPKQLLPIYDRPMIYYPIETLTNAGIKDILIITSPEHSSIFPKALGDGTLFGATFTYAIQDAPKGIAEAINIGRDFIGDSDVSLITGDTVLISESITTLINKAIKAVNTSGCATVFVNKDNDPHQYGKVILKPNGKVETIVGSSNLVNYCSITGLYVYPNSVIDKVYQLSPSSRGLYEITDLNLLFLKENKMQVLQLPNDCRWLDTNSFDSLLAASEYIKKSR